MQPLLLTYPCNPSTMAPGRLRSSNIALVADTVRNHVALHPDRPRIDMQQVVARLRRLDVNDILLTLGWDLDGNVRDEGGYPAYGSTEAAGDCSVLIRVNVQIAGDEPMARSTALHELGHAIFDGPGWYGGNDAAVSSTPRRFFSLTSERRPRRMDWSEWRANEFMGNFLAPRRLLHDELVKRARTFDVPLVPGRYLNERPIALDCAGLSWLVDELGELFGLTSSFIEVRLAKYGLVAPSGRFGRR